MHIAAGLLPVWVTWFSGFLVIIALAVALRRAQWPALQVKPGRMHLLAGGALACLLLWLINIHTVPGLVLHFLGVTTLTLVVGWSFALLVGSVAMLVFYMIQGFDWSGLPLSLLLTLLIPATISRWLARALYRPALRHPFVYFLGAGFAGSGLVVLALGLIALTLFSLIGPADYAATMLEFWPIIALIMFSEGFINGMCISALAVFYPDWVKTFDDRFYLGKP